MMNGRAETKVQMKERIKLKLKIQIKNPTDS